MNINRLKAKCIEKGMNFETLAKSIGLEKSTFYRKLKASSFTVIQVNAICRCLHLTHDEIIFIFFDSNVA